MTSLETHRKLLADKVRTECYRKAIFQTVKKGDVVLDLGTGTGILAFLACEAGARKVYAVEKGEVIRIAQRICRGNRLQDRVLFLKNFSHRVDLPEPVDLVLTETMGNFGLDEGLPHSVLDARRRFLKKGGRIIPQSIELFAVPVELGRAYRKIDFWSKDLYGLDFSAVRTFAANRLYPVDLDRHDFLSRPASLARIHLATLKVPTLRGELSFVMERNGLLHGIGGWFSARLCAGVSVSNAPPNQAPNWKNAFFPLEKPLPVKKGESIEVRICTMNDGLIWSWQVAGRQARFGHSTIFGFPFSKGQLRRKFVRGKCIVAGEG